MSDLPGWFGPWVSHKVAVKTSAGVQTPEGLTGAGEFTSMGCCHMPNSLLRDAVICHMPVGPGWWQETSAVHHMALSTWLLECPHDITGFLQSE